MNKIANLHFNIYLTILFIIFSFCIDFFYLINPSIVDVSDLNLIIIIIFSIIIFISIYNRTDKKTVNDFFLIFCSIFMLVIFSSLQSYILYKQPFWYGFRAQRTYLVYPLIFLIIKILINHKKITFSQIINLMFVISSIEMIIGFIQFLVGDKFVFTYSFKSFESSYGNYMRLYFYDTYIILTSFVAIERYKKNNQIKYLLYIFVSFIFIALVTQSRMATLMFGFWVVCSLLFVGNFKKDNVFSKSVIFVGFIAISLIFFFGTSMGKSLLESFQTGDFSTDKIRKIGRDFYLQTILNNFLGGGFINTLWEPAFNGSLMNKGVYIVDNGVFGFLFVYGWPGIFYLIIIESYSIYKGIKIAKYKKEYSFFIFVLFSISTSLTLQYYATSMSLITWIIISYFSNEKIDGNFYVKKGDFDKKDLI